MRARAKSRSSPGPVAMTWIGPPPSNRSRETRKRRLLVTISGVVVVTTFVIGALLTFRVVQGFSSPSLAGNERNLGGLPSVDFALDHPTADQILYKSRVSQTNASFQVILPASDAGKSFIVVLSGFAMLDHPRMPVGASLSTCTDPNFACQILTGQVDGGPAPATTLSHCELSDPSSSGSTTYALTVSGSLLHRTTIKPDWAHVGIVAPGISSTFAGLSGAQLGGFTPRRTTRLAISTISQTIMTSLTLRSSPPIKTISKFRGLIHQTAHYLCCCAKERQRRFSMPSLSLLAYLSPWLSLRTDLVHLAR
jgi:hypothetical protein